VSETFENLQVRAGDILVQNATVINHKGKGINLKEVMLNLEIYEDLMSPFITGKLTFADANAIEELLPFIGEEILILDMVTPGFGDMPEIKKHYVYHIYKIEGQEPVAIKNNILTLCFCSIEMFTDVNCRQSRKYEGNIGALSNFLMTDEDHLNTYKDVVSEPTSNNEIFVSNYWTPAQSLYYLTSRAINKNGFQDYVFFENNEGFIFASLESLYASPEVWFWFKHSKARDGDEPPNLAEDYSTVLDWSVPVYLDYLDRVQNGYYGASIYHADVLTKRINFRNMITVDDLSGYRRLNPYLPFSDKEIQFRPEAALTLNVIHRFPFKDSPVLPITHTVRRQSILQQQSSHTVTIKVFGRLNYTVGRTIYLTVYKNREASEKSYDIDEMLTGRWIISSLNHSITRETHFCNIELTKESLIHSINATPNV